MHWQFFPASFLSYSSACYFLMPSIILVYASIFFLNSSIAISFWAICCLLNFSAPLSRLASSFAYRTALSRVKIFLRNSIFSVSPMDEQATEPRIVGVTKLSFLYILEYILLLSISLSKSLVVIVLYRFVLFLKLESFEIRGSNHSLQTLGYNVLAFLLR